MDRSDNPGNIERQMDETPVERENLGGGMDRDAMQGGGSVEREGIRSGGGERENLRDGGLGYDRPINTPPARDMDPADSGDRMRGSSRDTGIERSVGNRGRETTGEGISRDW